MPIRPASVRQDKTIEAEESGGGLGEQESCTEVRGRLKEERVLYLEEDGKPQDTGGAGSSRDGLSQGVAPGQGEDDERPEEGEDGQSPKRLHAPHRVSKEEREAHELTHTPYRAWCKHCVRARGRNAPHRTREEERKSGGIPKVAMDYFFMSRADEEAHKNPLIVMVDESTGEKYARAVGQKGMGADNEMTWLVKDLSDELKAWGHPGGEAGHIILKSDGERSIVAVRDALARYHGGKVVPENPPRGESQSNGTVEEAGKTVREFVRVFKEQVEHSAKVELECAEVLTAWMVRWAAMVCSRYLVGKDGLTAYARRTGKKCQIPVVTFGEKVWYKELRSGKERRSKFDSEWREGAWLGHSRNSNEAIVGTRDGVVRAYAIKRQDEDQRWDADLLRNLQGSPQQPDPNKPGLAIPTKVTFDPPAEEEPILVDMDEKQTQVRRMKITAHILRKYGFTEGCEGCRFRRAGLGEHRGHTEECRQRIEAEMEGDEEGKRKKDEAKERINRRMAEAKEHEDCRRQHVPDLMGSGGGAAKPSRNAAAGGADERSLADEPVEPTDVQGDATADAEDRESFGRPSGRLGERTNVGAEETPAEGAGASDSQDEPACPGGGTKARRSSQDIAGASVKRRMEAGPDREAEKIEETCVKRRKDENASPDPSAMDTDGDGIVQCLMKASVDVAEIYSPPRVTSQAQRFGLKIGEAMDLTTGWDFTKAEHKKKAMQYIEEQKPKLIIGSPMCTMFSPLQRMSDWNAEKERRWREDRRHLQFIAQVYRTQATQGRWFLHEHLAAASSWSLKEIIDLVEMDGVAVVRGDQCMYGLKTWGKNGKDIVPAKKSTKFMSNSAEIRNELSRRCDGQHAHQSLTGGRAEGSARYPEELCKAICRGLIRELSYSEKQLMKLVDVGPDTTLARAHKAEKDEEQSWQRAWDDVTGEELDAREVSKARLKEMAYVQGKSVWKVIPRAEATRKGWKVIQTRWIDINKGDRDHPNYRSRLVAKEFNDGTQHDGLFAATPPLEALRLLISEAATIRNGAKENQKVVMINDVARAFFEAPVRRTVCVELPTEAKGQYEGEEDVVGLLQMSLYGTRDAAANFQEEVKKTMTKLGFVQSRYSPSVYWHQGRGLLTLVHGDDFITTGDREHARWFKEALEKRFEIKTKVVGMGHKEAREERVLNRVLRVTEEGWEYEADQRHAELIVEGMNLSEANSVKSPSEDEKPWEEEDNDTPIPQKEAYAFRRLAARANYLAQDRADIQYAAKEVCQGMAQPTKGHVKKLRRLARYLIGAPRVIWKFRYQGDCDQITVYSDSDWAGCRRTARSTSGGVIMRGSHCLRTWSSTQKFVTLSSAEAELMAAVKASTEGIGITQLAADWGLRAIASVYVDSSAALAVVGRKGNGKLRHVRVGHLWLQEKASTGDVSYRKVRGETNPADLLTKSLPAHKVAMFSQDVSQYSTSGHAKVRLALH